MFWLSMLSGYGIISDCRQFEGHCAHILRAQGFLLCQNYQEDWGPLLAAQLFVVLLLGLEARFLSGCIVRSASLLHQPVFEGIDYR
jgi:hypothetical protein